MATTKEQMILSAVASYTQNHETFRNKHLTSISGLMKQDVNYYLNKWEQKGYVARSPLAPADWFVVDLPGLIESLMPTEDEYDLRHMKIVSPTVFDEEKVEKFTELTELYAVCKAAGISHGDLAHLKQEIQKVVDRAIDELRTELKYMHTKRFSASKAKQRLANTDLKKITWAVKAEAIERVLES